MELFNEKKYKEIRTIPCRFKLLALDLTFID